MSKWTRYNSALKRAFDDFEFTSCDIYNYSGGGYDATTGEVSDGTRSKVATIDVEITEVDAETNRTPAGHTSEADVQMWVRDDTSVSWNAIGADEEGKPTEVVTPSGTVYLVRDVVDEGNGTLRLDGVEQ